MLAGLIGKKNADNTPIEAISPAPEKTDSLIRLRKIIKTYYTAAGDFMVLKGIDADFRRGEFVGVIGKSGSGKSTLINMITGIDRPTAGEVYVEDVAVHLLSESEMAAWRGRNLGIVFQFFQLLPMLSLQENVMLPMDFCNVYESRERPERAMELLKLVGMEDHAHKLPSAISGGQQQRVAIARALANDPPIIIADEPTGNLDSRTAEHVFEMFEKMVGQGKTIVMVTHDIGLAKRIDRTLLIADGEIVNEWVFRTMPQLSHQQMLHATRELEQLVFEPGQVIIQEDQVGDNFYIIREGRVEIALKRPGGDDIVVTRMGPGEYFGEIELLRQSRAIATVRAGEVPVRVMSLDREVFMALMSESEPTREAMEHIIHLRMNENLETRKKMQ